MIRVVITPFDRPPPTRPPVVTGIVAASGGQSGATLLTGRVNVVETVPPGTAVLLQFSGPLFEQKVLNRGMNPLAVYPPGGVAIEANASNDPADVPVDGSATFIFDGVATCYVS